MRERTFWRAVAGALAVALAAMLAVEALATMAVPAEARAFVASCLACIAVGATVVSPRSSPVRLGAERERAVRRRQAVVALVVSVAVALLLTAPAVRVGPTPWVLAPVVALGPVLLLRERWGRRR
jgi:amino acid transporter